MNEFDANRAADANVANTDALSTFSMNANRAADANLANMDALSTFNLNANRINRIYNHPLFTENLEALREDEADRPYCGHDMNHFLDVARIMTIMAYDAGLNVAADSQLRELIYAAALLHDIGRHMQYSKGIPHHEASVHLAADIMADCGFDKTEIASVCEAIADHRSPTSEVQVFLSSLLSAADKKSRQCYSCKVRNECKWSSDKMNMEIEI